MANTNYGVNHPLAVSAWAKKLYVESLKATSISKFIGSGSDSLIQIKDELSKGPGDNITFGLRAQLQSAGVSGDDTLEGNEEALVTYSDNIYINQIRNAVRSAGQMSEQRVSFSVREEGRLALVDWQADRLDTWFFNQIAGNTAQTDTKYTGLNTVTAPDANHIVYPDGDTSEADVSSSSASSVMSLTWIDYCVEKAKTLDIPIRPLRVNGESKYVMFLHPQQVTDLRTNTSTGQWLDIQKAVAQGGVTRNNPIFTGALGEYNGVVLHENTRVPLAPGLTDVRRAIFCGAQAAAMAIGRRNAPNRMTWREEMYDYGNQLGIGISIIAGIKKTIFNSEDFATIVVPTYSVAHA